VLVVHVQLEKAIFNFRERQEEMQACIEAVSDFIEDLLRTSIP